MAGVGAAVVSAAWLSDANNGRQSNVTVVKMRSKRVMADLSQEIPHLVGVASEPTQHISLQYMSGSPAHIGIPRSHGDK